jgi:hypothetical protein
MFSSYFICFNFSSSSSSSSSSFVQPITARDEVNKWGGWNYFETEKLVSHYSSRT